MLFRSAHAQLLLIAFVLLIKSNVPADTDQSHNPLINTVFAEFKLPSTHGFPVDPLSPSSPQTRGMIYIFTLCDCPIANAYAPEISRIAKEFSARNFDFFLVHTDPQTTVVAAQKHAEEYSLDLTVLLDIKHELVGLLKAESVPQVFLVSPDLKVLYKGRIDDRNTAYGKRRAEPGSRDLRNALDAVIQGKPVPNPITPVIGCYIPTLPAGNTDSIK